MSQSMYDFLLTECIKNPSDMKIFFGRKISGQELLDDIGATAGFLQSKGIKKGDVVALCLPNIPQAVVSLYAVNMIGAIAYPLHPKTGSGFFAKEVKEKDIKAVFLFDRFVKRYRQSLANLTVIVCGLGDYLPFPKSLLSSVFVSKKYYRYKAVLKSAKGAGCDSDGDETAIYLNSGGTTGEAKTVMLPGKAFNELALNMRTTASTCKNYFVGTGMLFALPIFHGFGLGVSVHAGLLGGYVVPIPVFRPSSVIKTMKRVPVHIVVGVPGMLVKLCNDKRFAGEFLRNIKLIFTGGDRVSTAIKQKFEKALSESGCDTKVMEGYGLSEEAGVVTIDTQGAENSIGQPIAGVKVKIFGKEGELSDGEQGEIGVCSPSVMNGYFGGKEVSFVNDGEDRYLLTGDIGYKKGESVYFVGREKRMIKIGGINVFPSQIEEEAVKFDGIRQACAVRTRWKGKPAIKLLVVTDKAIGNEFKKELTEYLGKTLIKYAEPKIIERVSEIKTTLIGKADYAFYEREEGRANPS